VEKGQFHVYPVRTVDEGLEILTGLPAGELQEDGAYPEESIHGRVAARLEAIAENLKPRGENEDQEEGNGAPGDKLDSSSGSNSDEVE
jgi:hypothetical protein